jgi:hypothetical protein
MVTIWNSICGLQMAKTSKTVVWDLTYSSAQCKTSNFFYAQKYTFTSCFSQLPPSATSRFSNYLHRRHPVSGAFLLSEVISGAPVSGGMSACSVHGFIVPLKNTMIAQCYWLLANISNREYSNWFEIIAVIVAYTCVFLVSGNIQVLCVFLASGNNIPRLS